MPMPDNASGSTALRSYVGAVVAASLKKMILSVVGLRHAPHPLEWFLFAALALLISGSFTVAFASIEASITVSDTFFITSALLFGPAPATVALALDSFIFSWRRKQDWTRRAFNTSGPALSMWCASQVFFLLSGGPPLAQSDAPLTELIVPLLCLIVVYFMLNSGLTAV